MSSLFARYVATLFVVLIALAARVTNANPGDVDTTYGVNGYYLSNVGDEAVGSLIQPDGKLVYVGRCPGRNGAFLFCITRLTTSGVLDTSFGTQPTPTGRILVQAGDANSLAERAIAVTRQIDGKLVVGGDCAVGGASQLCFLRYDASGALDASFGTAGKAYLAKATGGTFGTSGPNTLTAMKARANGQILFAGSWSAGVGDVRPMVGRLTASGAIDTSFAAPTGYAIFDTSATSGSNQMNAIAVRADHRIVAAGSCERLINSGGLGNPNYFTSKACAWFLNADGTADLSSGGPNFGTLTISGSTAVNADNSFTSVAIRGDDSLIFTGICGTTSSPLMCYFTLNFATLGSSSGVTAAGQKFSSTAVAITSDGGAVLVGTKPLTSTTSEMAIGVLPPDLAAISASGGIVPVAGGYNQGDAGGGLQPDGKILIVGNCGTSAAKSCATRLIGLPQNAPRCSLDIDGDGGYTPTIDGLIATRVMLGLADTAVTGGITFPTNAPRKTWTDIRKFLVTQCGMQLP